MSPYSLKALNLDDLDSNRDGLRDRVLRWLAEQNVREWWGRPGEAFALLSERAADQAAVLLCAGPQVHERSVGCACWQALSDADRALVFGASSEADDRIKELRSAQIMDVDLFVGEVDARGRGAGPVFLQLIAARIRSEHPDFRAGLCVSEANQRSLRAALKAGFQKQHCFEDPDDGPTWLLLRSTDEQAGNSGAASLR